MNYFSDRLQGLFAKDSNAGLQWKSAAARALGISRPALYKYLQDDEKTGGENIPSKVIEALESLEQEAQALPDEKDLVERYAIGLTELQNQMDTQGWVSAPYPSDLKRAFDIAASLNLRAEKCLYPDNLVTLVHCAKKPLYEWCPDLSWDPNADFTAAQLLEGGEITPECSLIAEAATDGEERAGYQLLINKCSTVTNPQELYVAWRKFVIQSPVLESAASSIRSDDVLVSYLIDALDLFDHFYEPVSRSLAPDGYIYLCPFSGTRLLQGDREWLSESRDNGAKNLLKTDLPDKILYTPEIRQLKRVFRQFWCLPGIYELQLYNSLRESGWHVDLWPELDSIDLLAESPDGKHNLAIDVKDYLYSVRLANSFNNFKQYQRQYQCLIVIPDYLVERDPDYLKKFNIARRSAGRSKVEIKTMGNLLSDLSVPLL